MSVHTLEELGSGAGTGYIPSQAAQNTMFMRDQMQQRRASQMRKNDAEPAVKRRYGTDPEHFILECIICRNSFQGPGHNPEGYAKRVYVKKLRCYRSFKCAPSRYGQITGRCCAKCNTVVMRWRGADGMP
jgi:hypothetical protein